MTTQPPTEVRTREDEANFAAFSIHSIKPGPARHGRNCDGTLMGVWPVDSLRWTRGEQELLMSTDLGHQETPC